MPNSFEIAAASGSYAVTVGQDLVEEVVQRHPNAVYIVDANLVDNLPEAARARVVVIAEEQYKALEYMPTVVAALREHQVNRDSYLVAVGGGIIQDIVTFVASIYMRGLPWTYMPTTVLAMVDSCIGGKSSINVQSYKNLVGNFYPPKDVVIDTRFIATLDKEMVVGGLYEAAKICYARGYDQFLSYLAHEPGYPLSADQAEATTLTALLTKKWFIETDEFDQKERLLLNFGHTFGHAIEGGTDFGVSHGIAVGVGMLVAARYAKDTKALSTLGLERVGHLERHIQETLLPASGPVIEAPPVMPIATILEKFEYDKKHRRESYRIVIPQEDGGLSLVYVPKDEAVRSAFRTAYEETFDALGWSRS
ncbi:MAG: 3-dehydroquinate synthase [Rhodospirillaceae bacterium]